MGIQWRHVLMQAEACRDPQRRELTWATTPSSGVSSCIWVCSSSSSLCTALHTAVAYRASVTSSAAARHSRSADSAAKRTPTSFALAALPLPGVSSGSAQSKRTPGVVTAANGSAPCQWHNRVSRAWQLFILMQPQSGELIHYLWRMLTSNVLSLLHSARVRQDSGRRTIDSQRAYLCMSRQACGQRWRRGAPRQAPPPRARSLRRPIAAPAAAAKQQRGAQRQRGSHRESAAALPESQVQQPDSPAYIHASIGKVVS